MAGFARPQISGLTCSPPPKEKGGPALSCAYAARWRQDWESENPREDTDEWKKFDFIGDHRCKGVASRIPCAVGEPQGTRQLFNSVFPRLQYPKMAQQLSSLSHSPRPNRAGTNGLSRHGRSAGQVSGGFGPCSYQFLPGEASLGLRDQLVFARLFKQNWRL